MNLRDRIAKEIFIRIATERVNRNHFSTWDKTAERCLQVSASFVKARAKPLSKEGPEDADNN